MQLRGRHWILLWLLVFLVVAGTVIGRQTRAYARAAELARIRERRAALEAQRSALERAIETAASRAVIGRKAAALGLRAPTDDEYRILQLPSAAEAR
jgi:cell division protein FtsL